MSMLDIIENETYEMSTLAFSPGDSVCFMTDGIGDVLAEERAWGEVAADKICGRFGDEDQTDKLRDDATAICITVRELARREKKQEDETRWKQV
jgi:serine phosphatase RsbU (regulator of sigma subunit)